VLVLLLVLLVLVLLLVLLVLVLVLLLLLLPCCCCRAAAALAATAAAAAAAPVDVAPAQATFRKNAECWTAPSSYTEDTHGDWERNWLFSQCAVFPWATNMSASISSAFCEANGSPTFAFLTKEPRSMSWGDNANLTCDSVDSWIAIWIMIVDWSFILDLVAQFFTGVDRGFEVIYDKKKIAGYYMNIKSWQADSVVAGGDSGVDHREEHEKENKLSTRERRLKHAASGWNNFLGLLHNRPVIQSWFFVDFVSTFELSRLMPLDLEDWEIQKLVTAQASAKAQDWGHESLVVPGSLNLSSMIRLLKILRVARMGRLIGRLTTNVKIHTAFIEACKFFLLCALLAHILACCFFMTSSYFCKDTDWITINQPLMHGESKHTMHYCEDHKSFAGYATLKHLGPIECCVNKDCSPADASDGDIHKANARAKAANKPMGSQCSGHLPKACEPKKPCAFYCWNRTDAYAETGELQLAHDVNETITKYGGSSVNNNTQVCKHSWRNEYSDERGLIINLLPPSQQWHQAFYWSITTMTTIGYGDRGPTSKAEVGFVMAAEVASLLLFTVLLQQITILAEVNNAEEDAGLFVKNDLMAFLKHHAVDDEIVKDVVRFINFRNVSLTRAQDSLVEASDNGERPLPLRCDYTTAELPADPAPLLSSFPSFPLHLRSKGGPDLMRTRLLCRVTCRARPC